METFALIFVALATAIFIVLDRRAAANRRQDGELLARRFAAKQRQDAEHTLHNMELRDRILGAFCTFPDLRDTDPTQVGIEMDWVAMSMCGLPVETKERSLDADARSRFLLTRESLIRAAERLVDEGLLIRYPIHKFDHSGPNQICKPPRGLFMLTSIGVAEVLKRRPRC